MMEPMLEGLPSFAEEQDAAALYPYHLFDKAHLVMLAEESLIPRDDVAAMLEVLRGTEPDKIVESRLEAGGAMHSGEYLLIRRLGEEVGGRMHLGRSSGDLHAVWRRCRQTGLAADAYEGDKQASRECSCKLRRRTLRL